MCIVAYFGGRQTPIINKSDIASITKYNELNLFWPNWRICILFIGVWYCRHDGINKHLHELAGGILSETERRVLYCIVLIAVLKERFIRKVP